MPRPVSGTNGNGNGVVPPPAPQNPLPRPGQSDAHPGGLVGALRRHWFLIVFTAVIATAAGYAVSQVQDQTYTASAQVLVDPTSPEATALGADAAQDSGSQFRSTATVAKVAGSRPIAEATSEALDGRLSPAEVQDRIEIVPDQDANVLRVEATDGTADGSAQLANAFAAQFVRIVTDRAQRSARRARQALQKRYDALSDTAQKSSSGEDLRDQVQRLRTLELIGGGQVSVLENAEAPGAGNNSPLRTILLGALFGLLLGGAFALLRDQVDRRVRRDEDLESLLGVPVLAQVPDSRGLGKGRPVAELRPVEVEPFRLLWTRLRFGQWRKPMQRVLVTSARMGEGKSVVSWYLASVAAESGARVLLIEADARRPVIAERHGLAPAPGLLGLVREDMALEDATVRVPVEGEDGLGGAFDVLQAGGGSLALTSLHATERVLHLLADEVAGYDLVVVDAPPVTMAAEAIPLSTAVDGVLVVARAKLSTREGLTDVRDQLLRLHAETIGVVRGGAAVPAYYGYASAASASS
jgi:capsular polysaccharide biosynthesis protein